MSGIYTGTMGIISNMGKLNVISNNIANSQTNGFKREDATFRVFQEGTMVREDSKNTSIGSYYNQVYHDDTVTDYSTGMFYVTDEKYDFALKDDATSNVSSFFVVSKGDKEYLTRNGQFSVDADRRLVTPGGALVTNTQGDPVVLGEERTFVVKPNGDLLDTKTNEVFDTIRMTSVKKEDLGLLDRGSAGLYSVMGYNKAVTNFGSLDDILSQFDNNPTLQSVFGSKDRVEAMKRTGGMDILLPFQGNLQHQMLESSNVDMASEMIDLITAQKHLNASKKTFSVADEILKIEAEQLGR